MLADNLAWIEISVNHDYNDNFEKTSNGIETITLFILTQDFIL